MSTASDEIGEFVANFHEAGFGVIRKAVEPAAAEELRVQLDTWFDPRPPAGSAAVESEFGVGLGAELFPELAPVVAVRPRVDADNCAAGRRRAARAGTSPVTRARARRRG